MSELQELLNRMVYMISAAKNSADFCLLLCFAHLQSIAVYGYLLQDTQCGPICPARNSNLVECMQSYLIW